MNRASFLLAPLLVAATLTLASANSTRGAVDALLYEAISAPATVSYSGVVQFVRIGSRHAEASVYRVEHRAPDLTRRTYTAPSAISGDAVVSKGDITFSIDPKRRRIVEARNDALDDRAAWRDNYALMRQNYRAVEQGAESFDGRPTVDVLLINKYSHRPALLVRIDRESKIVLDQQEFGTDGSMISDLRFEAVRYTPAIPSRDFNLPKAYAVVPGPTFAQPSEDPERVARSAGFAAREPRSLPDGFEAVEGNIVELKGVRTLHVLYSDGIRTVSLFENARPTITDMTHLQPEPLNIGGHSGEYAEDGATSLLSWSDGTLHYALVSDLQLTDLRNIAAAIAP
jgi:negative regulator of sigma E activity